MNDDAIAYGFASLVALLFVGALLWIMGIPFINGMTDQLNTMGAAGHASAQTFAAFGLASNLYRYGVPVFILLIAVYYAINRALLKRKEEMYG